MLVSFEFDQLLSIATFLIRILENFIILDATIHIKWLHSKRCFYAVSRNKSLQHNLFDEGYQYVSIDFESVSTNVPGFIIRNY